MRLLQKKTAVTLASLAGVGTLSGNLTPAVSADNVVNTRTTNRTGALDISVDHSALDDAVRLATAQGIQVTRDATRVRMGNATEAEKYRKEATDYYKERMSAIKAATEKYKADLATYEQNKIKAEEAVREANAELEAYKTSLAALGRGVTFKSQAYSDASKAAALDAVKEGVKIGEQYRDAKNAVDTFNALQNSMVGFQTHADQGHIKVKYKDIVVSNAEDVKQYTNLLTQAESTLNEYISKLPTKPGVLPENTRPEFILYRMAVSAGLTQQVNTPVAVPHFEVPKFADKPIPPKVNYAYYDIRQTSDTDNVIHNADGENIVIKSQEQDGGNVHQAMVNQTVGIVSTNDPLPAGRFDKYHALTVTVNLPNENVEVDEKRTKADNPNWTAEIDKAHNRIIFRATDDYLIKINEKQAARQGTIGGIMTDKFDFDVPAAFVKLTKDNTNYTFSSDVMINHEYKANSGTVHVRTNQADPQKHNKDDKGVVIDGKTVFFGITNNYHLTWDFDQYKGVNIDKEMQDKGLDLIDFYPSDALDFDPATHKITIRDGDKIIAVSQADGSFIDGDKKVVDGLTWSKVDSYKGIDRKGPAIKVSIKGYDHPYYKQFVEAGKSLDVAIQLRTRVIDQTPGVTGGVYGGNTYTNVFYQSDFGNIYKSNEVVNKVTTLDPRKDAVLSVSQLSSLDLKSNPTAEIEHNTYFQYRASGSKIDLSALGRAPESYSITDAFHEADQYDGVYFAESNGDIYFKEGTPLYAKYRRTGGKLPKDSDVTKFTTQTIVRNQSNRGLNTATGTVGDKADGRFSIVNVGFDQDFLDQIDASKSTFQMDVFFQVKRVKNVDSVDNVFQEEVNGIVFDSTETLTNTRENDVDTLKHEVKKLDEKITTTNTTISGVLSVIRRQVDRNTAQIDKNIIQINKNGSQIDKNTTQIDKNTADIASHAKQIDENRSAILSVRQLAESIRGRVDAIEPKVEQADSQLTIYVPFVNSNSDALLYATNHGVAAGSIKKIELDDKNHYVVTYNTSSTAINGSPLTNGTVAAPKISSALSNIDNSVSNEGNSTSEATFTTPVTITDETVMNRIDQSEIANLIVERKLLSGNQYEFTMRIVDGYTRDKILDILDRLTRVQPVVA